MMCLSSFSKLLVIRVFIVQSGQRLAPLHFTVFIKLPPLLIRIRGNTNLRPWLVQ